MSPVSPVSKEEDDRMSLVSAADDATHEEFKDEDLTTEDEYIPPLDDEDPTASLLRALDEQVKAANKVV